MTPVPDRSGLVWEQRHFPTDIEDNPFTGSPRPELDKAWHDLLQSESHALFPSPSHIEDSMPQ